MNTSEIQNYLTPLVESIKANCSGSADYLSGVNDGAFTIGTKLLEPKQLYFFAQDDSGHWYMIPAHLRVLWDQADSLQGNNEEAYETAMEMFDDFRTDGPNKSHRILFI